jgi:ABC-type multidrug transport system fused ATPase/permease subunit
MNRSILSKSIKLKLFKIGFIQIFLGLLEMVNLLLIYKIIVYSITAIQANQSNISVNLGDSFQFRISLLNLLLSLLTYLIIKLLISVLFVSIKNKILTNITKEISDELFVHFINMPFSRLNLINTSSLLQNIRGESVFLTRYLTALTLVFYESITVIVLILFLIYVDFSLTIFITGLLLLLGIVFFLFTRKKLIFWGGLRHKIETKLTNQIIETFDGMREVIIYGKRQLFTMFFKKANSEKFEVEKNNLTLTEISIFFFEFFIGFAIFSVIGYFSFFEKPKYDLNTLIFFPLAAYRILPGLNRIMNSFQALSFNRKSVYNINAILQEKYIDSTFENETLKKIDKISLIDVTFSYDSTKQLFKNFSFNIHKNSILGVQGPSGSGKSTFIDLISGLLSPSSGIIMADEINIATVATSYQKLVGYVGQSPYMIEGSLIDNISFERDSTIDESLMLSCCLSANIDFVALNIQALRDFWIIDKGTNLSGGQRQRIALARALYKKPEILILDEFTSALDIENEKILLNSVKRISKDKIVVIVSHKSSTLGICNTLLNFSKSMSL